jgi:hypothetical protein
LDDELFSSLTKLKSVLLCIKDVCDDTVVFIGELSNDRNKSGNDGKSTPSTTYTIICLKFRYKYKQITYIYKNSKNQKKDHDISSRNDDT